MNQALPIDAGDIAERGAFSRAGAPPFPLSPIGWMVAEACRGGLTLGPRQAEHLQVYLPHRIDSMLQP